MNCALLGSCERLENAFAGRACLGTNAVENLAPFCGEGELTRAAILAVDAPVEEALLLQPLHQYARVVAVDPERFCETALINSRKVIEELEHGVLKLRDGFVGESLGDHRDADLLEAPGERSRGAANGDAARCKLKQLGQVASGRCFGIGLGVRRMLGIWSYS